MNSVFCPRCATESTVDLRYCRQCGASLEAVLDALEKRERKPAPTSTSRPESFERSLVLIRGFVTLFLALPCFLLMALIAISAALKADMSAVITIPIACLLLGFTVLGFRDLIRPTVKRRDADKTRELTATGGNTETRRFAEPPQSVTEHTTFNLERSQVEVSNETIRVASGNKKE
jgi:hypothetical protein